MGFAIAEGLGGAGARVVLNGRDELRLAVAVEKLRGEGIEAHGLRFDVTNSADVMLSVDQAEREIGPVDILVNNAGIIVRTPLETLTEEQWHAVIATNLTGVFLLSKHIAAKMIPRRSGKIINICSMQSELGRPTIAAYAASKGGAKMLTKAMATEWGKHNIQVNGIGPGYIVSDLTQPLVQDEKFSAWLCARTPAGRWGQPEDLIGAAVFLASRASDYVNGHILYVDGGLLACV